MSLTLLFQRIIMVASAVILVAACSSPYKTPKFDSRPPNQHHFPGILSLTNTAPQKTLDVLLVHGICTHDRVWAANTIDNLREALGAEYESKAVPSSNVVNDTLLYQTTLIAHTGTLRVNAIVWSPVVAELKKQLCYDQTNKSDLCWEITPGNPAYPHTRSILNAKFKDALLNDCLVDAIIYQGKSRDAISKQLQQAILTALASSGGRAAPTDIVQAAAAETAPLVVITESLGSKIAFDAIYQLATSHDLATKAAGKRTFDRTTQIFMGANQTPLLALADQNLDGTADTSHTAYPIDALMELIASRRDMISTGDTTQLRVVAFTDPNDLLSYVLAPSKPIKPYDVVDVVVSNAKTYLGLFENPLTAHTGYRENREVLRLIACGNPTSSLCPE